MDCTVVIASLDFGNGVLRAMKRVILLIRASGSRWVGRRQNIANRASWKEKNRWQRTAIYGSGFCLSVLPLLTLPFRLYFSQSCFCLQY